MNSYIPHTDDERRTMLEAVGAADIEGLLGEIPADCRLQSPMELPAPLSEYALNQHVAALAAKNISAASHICLMGGGIYDHYIPSVVNHLASRQEFYTAYTPYQAEMSQGTLQAIFEYQTLITRLTGTDVSNASVYDGATACAEAILMAQAIKSRRKVLLAGAVHPEYRATCATYAGFRGIHLQTIGWDGKAGGLSMADLAAKLDGEVAAVLVQSPNYFGVIEDLSPVAQLCRDKGALLIVACNPVSLGILAPPGKYADIVVGEGQSLGNPMNFGGPGFGFFCCKQEYVRKMPGRIVGQTSDNIGKRGFVLTIQAREQHIRREKATSNICSNQALCALRATVYMAALGQEGLRELAGLCYDKAHYLYDRLLASGRFAAKFDGPFFNEFIIRYQGDIKAFQSRMITEGFMPGIDVSGIPGMEGCLLLAVTEKRTREEMDAFCKKAVSA